MAEFEVYFKVPTEQSAGILTKRTVQAQNAKSAYALWKGLFADSEQNPEFVKMTKLVMLGEKTTEIRPRYV